MTCPKVKLFSRSKFQMGLCVTNRDNYLEKTEAESEHPVSLALFCFAQPQLDSTLNELCRVT